jgi:hypothetical protein
MTFRVACAALLVALSVPFAPSAARAQAWLPAQGEGAVSFMYQDQLFKYHRIPVVKDDVGPIFAKSLLVDVTYGLTDKIAVSLGLPWVATRYNGPRPHPLADGSGTNPLDDGRWHSTAQDFRFDVRYNVTRNLWNKGIVLTPFAASIVPSHDYPYLLHSGAGRNLKELQIGASAAKLLDNVVPGLLVQGRYGYGFTERPIDIAHNRSVASIEVGYFATPKLRLMALTTGQLTHGGIDFTGPTARAILTPEQFLHHDQIMRENFLSVGGGASYSLGESIDVFGSALRTVSQRNGHELNRGLTVGLSWSFTTPHAKDRALSMAENSLGRCLCEKGTK